MTATFAGESKEDTVKHGSVPVKLSKVHAFVSDYYGTRPDEKIIEVLWQIMIQFVLNNHNFNYPGSEKKGVIQQICSEYGLEISDFYKEVTGHDLEESNYFIQMEVLENLIANSLKDIA